MVAVYKCRSSFEDNRPQIDFQMPSNSRNDWLMIGNVENGSVDIAQWPRNVALWPVFDTLPKKVLAPQRVTSTQRGRGTMRRNLM
jgi:hypothetical protein